MKLLSLLNRKLPPSEQRLNEQIERSESAFNAAYGAEQRNNIPARDHFLAVAIREEKKAFD